MSSLGDLYTHLKTLCEQWFYNKSTIDGYLNNKISKSSTVGLVKNDGSIDTRTYLTSHQDITGKEDKSNKVASWSSTVNDTRYPTEKLVKDSLDSLQSSIQNMTGLTAYEVTTDKGTASASTMGKLYIEVGSDTTDVYYTVEDNGSYSWESLDTDILDNLSIDWDDVVNKPSLFSGSYNDLSDKPSTFTPSSHTHGNITNDGKITTIDGNVLGYHYFPIIALEDGSLIKGHIQTGHIYDSFGRTNIGTSANSSLTTIMTAIDTALGNKANTSDLGAVALSNSYDDLDDLPTLFSGDYDDLINKPNIPQGVVVDTTLSSSSNNAIANSTVTTALNGKVDSNDSRLTDARTPTSHTHGYLQNGGTLTQTGTNNGNIVVTNSSNKIVIQSSIDVLDELVQDLITYGSS